MLSQLSRKDEPNSSLDLARSHRWLLVVAGQLSGLRGDFVKDVIDEAVEDGHSLRADASVRVNLRPFESLRYNSSGIF